MEEIDISETNYAALILVRDDIEENEKRKISTYDEVLETLIKQYWLSRCLYE